MMHSQSHARVVTEFLVSVAIRSMLAETQITVAGLAEIGKHDHPRPAELCKATW
jgi:hypothetical protein